MLIYVYDYLGYSITIPVEWVNNVLPMSTRWEPDQALSLLQPSQTSPETLSDI